MTITAYQQYAADDNRSWRRATFNVADFGAKGDGVTDDTAAIQAAINAAGAIGGGRVVLPYTYSPYLIAGPVKDVSGANAQLLLPSEEYGYGAGTQIPIVIEGEAPAGITYSVSTGSSGVAEPASGVSVLQSTATSGSVLGGYCKDSTIGGFTKVQATLKNLTFRLPPNPSASAIDFSWVAACEIDGVSCDTGNYSVKGLAEPSSAGSYALKMPKTNNGAYSRVRSFGAIGFYTGIRIDEHTHLDEATIYGCRRAGEVIGNGTKPAHSILMHRFNWHHCQYGLEFTGGNVCLDIDTFVIEHSSDGSWRDTIADIQDPDNGWHGQMRWSVGTARSTINVVGATNAIITRMNPQPAA